MGERGGKRGRLQERWIVGGREREVKGKKRIEEGNGK